MEEEIGISLPLSEIKHFDTYYFHPDDEPDYTLLWEVFSYDFLEKPTVILNAEHSEYVWAKRNDVFSYAMIESEDELFKDFFNINK